jgi:hypothetical protein
MSGDWQVTLWALLVTFCIVITRCTETFWSPCTNVCGIKTSVYYNQAQMDQSEQCAYHRLDYWRITVWFLPWQLFPFFSEHSDELWGPPASYSKCTRSHSPGVKGEEMNHTIHINIVLSLRTHCLHLHVTAQSCGNIVKSLLAENTNLTCSLELHISVINVCLNMKWHRIVTNYFIFQYLMHKWIQSWWLYLNTTGLPCSHVLMHAWYLQV